MTREVNGVNSYASQASYRVHFGLGQADRVERITIFWPSGTVQELKDLPADRHYRIVEAGDALSPEERRKLYFGAERGARSGGPSGEPGLAKETGAAQAVLLDLEEKLRRRPCNVEMANAYRSLCVDGRRFDRAIELFRQLVHVHPDHAGVRMQLALSIVDKIPFLEGDVLAQGSLAKESLNELRWVEDADPGFYPLHYVSGMNHLYWPDSLKHYDDAVLHFTKCLEIQKARTAAGSPPEPHHAEVYRALGDSHVKGKRFEAARAAWKEGLAFFTGHADLSARLAMSDDALSGQIKEERGLRKRIDTRLAWLSEENGLARAEAHLRQVPRDRAALNAYRGEAFELDRVARAVAFIEGLARENPGEPEPRLHLALALADKINSIGSPTEEAFRLANRLLGELEAFSSSSPTDWLGPYFVGICHLFRPPSAESARAAVEAFKEASLRARSDGGSARVPYTGVALGDALACAGDGKAAITVWQETQAAFPHAQGLAARLRCPPDSLRLLVRADYDLARGIPTNLDLLQDREGELASAEKSLRAEPHRSSAVRYRILSRKGDDPERSIRFLEGALKDHPRSATLRVELALAYMDRIPDRDLGSVRKGLLSSEALKLLEEVAAIHSSSWGLNYAIGLIHLNWFTKQKHLPHALHAFERCLEIQKGHEKESPQYALAYQAMGDAYLKDRESPGAFPRGRKLWKEGQELFPEDRGLAERMGLTAMMVNRYVDELRSWTSVQDTARLSALVGDLPDLPAAGEAR